MSGIAEMYRVYTGDEYLPGLWRGRLVEGLNWVVIDPAARPQNRFRAPSWSWAAVDSPVLPQSVNLPRDDNLIEVVNAKVEIPKTPAGWQQVTGSIELRGCLSKATAREASKRSSRGDNVALKLEELVSRFFAYPDTTDTTFERGKLLFLLPLRSTLRRAVKTEGTLAERHHVVILEGIIMEPVPELETSFRRIGRFVVNSLGHVEFFGLLAVRPWAGAKCLNVVQDAAKVSVLTVI